jgi:hypothetical protein
MLDPVAISSRNSSCCCEDHSIFFLGIARYLSHFDYLRLLGTPPFGPDLEVSILEDID